MAFSTFNRGKNSSYVRLIRPKKNRRQTHHLLCSFSTMAAQRGDQIRSPTHEPCHLLPKLSNVFPLHIRLSLYLFIVVYDASRNTNDNISTWSVLFMSIFTPVTLMAIRTRTTRPLIRAALQPRVDSGKADTGKKGEIIEKSRDLQYRCG
jgi:hypothetical protein